MPGIVRNVLPKTVFDFTGMAVGVTQVLVVANRIPIVGYVEAVIEARVHSVAFGGTNSLQFDLCPDGQTSEDPAKSFLAGPFFASSAVTSFAQSPPLLVTYGGSIRGELACLQFTAAKTGIGALSATVSIDLHLRTL